jgi:prepilin-type N-terminal cleavage/methylation domain-containing protein
MIAIATRARRGFTLVELLVVIGGVAVTLGVCVALIQSLLRLDRGARLHLAETSAVGRIGHQFRQDVRAASRAKEDASRLELALAAPDERIVEYEARPGALLRVERKGDQVVRRETYRVHRGGTPRFATERDQDDLWVSLVLAGEEETPSPGAGPSRAIRIEARLNNDCRLAIRREAIQ